MVNVRKRFLAGILVLVMALSFLPAQVFASGLEDETIAGAEDQATQEIQEETPEEIQEETPEEIPEENPEEIPEEIPEENPEEPPESTPEEIPEDTPGDVPGSAPEDAPEAPWKGTPEDILKDTHKNIKGNNSFPYYLLITHALEVDGEVYGETEMVLLTEDDFQDGVYDFRQNALDRTGMWAVRGSYQDKETYDLVESWTVTRDNFDMGGYPGDGSAYYAVQLLIEYEVASGYTAVVSDTPSNPGEYDVMPLESFKGPLGDIELKGVDIITLTLKFEYSRTGGLAGTAAADTAVVEVPVTTDNNGNVTAAPGVVTYGITSKDGFRMLLNPYPLNQFLVNPDLATMLTRADYTDPDIQAQIEKALADGSFAVVPGRVYQNGSTAQGGYTAIYNAAWDLARIAPATTKEIKDIATKWNVAENELIAYNTGSLAHPYYHATVTGGTSNPGAASVGSNPMLTVEITTEQAAAILKLQKDAAAGVSGAQQDLEDATTVTVYYRRNATSYTVKHWVPSAAGITGTQGTLNGVNYTMVYEETLQGRVGALTNAKSSPETAPFDFNPYVSIGFSQQEIRLRADENDEGTVINIYYENASAYRVIFNTDYTYIPRQLVDFGNSLTFGTDGNGNATLANHGTPVNGYRIPTRTGYTFDGWYYELKDGTTQDVGNTLTINSDLVSKAVITDTEEDTSYKALYLYPKWKADDANVRVVFWVENLSSNPANDVRVSVESPNKSSYMANHPGFTDAITAGTSYNNMTSVILKIPTDSVLNLSVSNNTLIDSNQLSATVGNATKSLTETINSQFTAAMGNVVTTTGSISAASFYSLVDVEVPDSRVSSDGSTVINVYYNRNIYSLDFTYYGLRDGAPYIAHNTKGFSNMDNPDPSASERYSATDGTYRDGTVTGIVSNGVDNRFAAVNPTDTDNFSFPQRIIIQAKYGADLQDVWPAAAGESANATSMYASNPSLTPFYFTSWAATAGPFNQAFKKDNSVESTLMGVYSTMNADIIAVAGNPSVTHHLYAYWANTVQSNYRYNHCYEIPQLKGLTSIAGLITHPIYGNGNTDSDKLYLIPCTVVDAYGYTDLMKVKYVNQAIVYEDDAGYAAAAGDEYYALRHYNGSYYAVVRRVTAVSTNIIAAQTPSDSPNLTKVGYPVQIGTTTYPYAPDHSTQYKDTDGATTKVTIGGETIAANRISDTYDLYFYYDRQMYTIHYMAPVTRADAAATEVELGTIEVPYGTILTEGTYKIALGYDKYNTDYSSYWTTATTTAVCPDRSTSGTAMWYFGGWYENRACTKEMTWEEPISKEVYLYAKWTNNGYTVTFDWGGATLPGVGAGDVVKYKEQNISANTRFTASGMIPRPLWTGHTLVGWALADVNAGVYTPKTADGSYSGPTITADNVTYQAFDFDQSITQNIDVVAVWTEQVTTTYAYTILYLWKVPDGYVGTAGEEFVTNPAGQEAGKYLVLGKEVKAEPYPADTTLWLTAKQFTGYTPVDANKFIELKEAGNNQAVFLYTKNATHQYTIQYVDGDQVIATDSKEDVEKPSTEVTNAMLVELSNKGYELVLDNDGNPISTTDGSTTTYEVQPIVYDVAYDSTAAQFVSTGGVTPSQNLIGAASALVKGLALQATAEKKSNVDDAKNANKNPTKYTVTEEFTLENPTYLQDPDTKIWWRFTGWTAGSDTVEQQQTTRAAEKIYETLKVESSVGTLTFYANWAPVTPDLTVKNEVKPAVPGMTLPNDAFSFTITLPSSVNYDNVLVYKTGGDQIKVTSQTIQFALKNGEELFIAGPAGGYIITENQDAPSFNKDDKNYYTLDMIAANGGTSQGLTSVTATVGNAPVSAVFTHTYHATVWLDTDPADGGDGSDRSFEIKKILLEDGVQRSFFGGNQYGILIRAGAQSDEGTPVPPSIQLTSSAGALEISSSFGAVRFTQPGTYTYVISEERPSGTTAVPGVSYDDTMYRVTVVVTATGSSLTARIAKLETRDTPDVDGGATGWTERALAVAGSLKNELLFQNTYNTTMVRRSYTFSKVLLGDRHLQAGEFTFTLERAGSHAMNQGEAEAYHNAIDDEARLGQLMGLEYAEDPAQRLPDGVDQTTGKVSNGEAGAITFGSLNYTAENMGGQPYGKVYKYTIKEDVPAGIIDGKYQGITYDPSTKELYVYVHLHHTDGTLAQLGDVGTLVYADVLGDRNGVFTNTFAFAPITVDIGENPDDPGANAATAQLTKTITGRTFTSGDTFTFNIKAVDGAPLPQKDGKPYLQAEIAPTSGNRVSIPFGTIEFTAPGIYQYKLTEVKGNASNMEYDTAEKTLTIRVHDDDGDGVLNVEIDGVTWTNRYTGTSGTPSNPGTPGTPSTPSNPSGPSYSGRPSYSGGPSTSSNEEKPPVALDTHDHFAYIVGKGDGLVHPNDYISRAEVATIFYRLLTEDTRKAYWTKTNPYSDVQIEDWFNVAVSVISNTGIVNGYSNGKFGPNNNITRGEFATIAARFLSEPYVGGDYFTDISSHWAREYINRAAAAGWVTGGDIPFRPDDYITRAEVMTIINAMIGRTPDKDHMHEDMIVWPDNMDTTKWYYEAVQEATNSHEYVRIEDAIEDWTEILPVRNWTEIEQAWSDIYDTENPGDVISSGF